MTVLVFAVLAFFAFASGSNCLENSFNTDAKSRTVYKCLNGKWGFHGKMIRPKSVVPVQAAISNKCKNNPDLNGSIAGFHCTEAKEGKIVDCLNTKIVYMCHNSLWQIYQIRGSEKKV